MSTLWPFIVIGLFSGSVYAMAAMGLVLTYKTSGIFNFAYGAIAMFCGFTFWQLRDGWHITAWVSLPVMLLVVAPVIGIVCERLFRPVTSLSAEIQIVIALGLLAFLQALVPIAYGPQDRALTSIFPEGKFGIASQLNVSYTQLCTLLLAGALAAGLYVLLRRTRFGLATQAVVDNRDLAGLIGVDGDNVSRVAWILSSVFAALVGILLSSNQGLDVYNLTLLAIVAFAPAVLGRLVSLPLAFAGAMALGVFQGVLPQFAGGNSNTLIADLEAALPFLALYVLLIVYGGRLKEVRSSLRAVTGSAPSVGPQKLAAQAGLFVVGATILPLVIHGSLVRDATAGLIIAMVGLTLVVLTGWAGQISLAQFTFVGIGAFTVGHFGGANGSGFWWAALLGAAIAVPVGVLVGVPSLRLSGLFLALATLSFALIFDYLVFVQRSIGGNLTGITVARPEIFGYAFASDTSIYYLVAAVFGALALGTAFVRRGPVGRRLQMIRDAPLGASTFGVNLTLTKLAVFAASGAVAAFAGAFYGAFRLTITPGDFAFGASLEMLLLIVLGGRALVAGTLFAGGTYMIRLLPLSTTFTRWVPLAVALGVILLAQYPEGPIQVATVQTRKYSALFRPRPRPHDDVEPLEPVATNGHRPSKVGAGAR
ncbi:MAG: branched-chain amino acid ABC transporter permease [Acidimicrobiales bacterium]